MRTLVGAARLHTRPPRAAQPASGCRAAPHLLAGLIRLAVPSLALQNIAAVVLRIDSPGGDALASDLMWREIRELSKVGAGQVPQRGHSAEFSETDVLAAGLRCSLGRQAASQLARQAAWWGMGKVIKCLGRQIVALFVCVLGCQDSVLATHSRPAAPPACTPADQARHRQHVGCGCLWRLLHGHGGTEGG